MSVPNYRELYRTAVLAQDGSNLQGLMSGMALAIDAAKQQHALTGGVPSANGHLASHPALILWVAKIHHMMGLGMCDSARYSRAMTLCEELALYGGPICPACHSTEVEQYVVGVPGTANLHCCRCLLNYDYEPEGVYFPPGLLAAMHMEELGDK